MNLFLSSALLSVALLALTVPPLAAADAVSGTFHYGATTFRPVDGVAFRQDGKTPGKPDTIVVLADFKIDRQNLVEAIESYNALATQVMRSGKGNFAMVKIVSPERCDVDAFLGEKQQQLGLIQFTSKVTSSTPARMAGECLTTKPEKMFDDAYDFRLKYDVAMLAIPKPTPLPPGGDEPGKALLALVDAIKKSNWPAVSALLPPDEVPKTKPDNLPPFFESLLVNYPKTAAVTGGLLKGNHAQLQMTGTDYDNRKIRGDYLLEKTAGKWRVTSQSLYTAD
ncbi:MAG: hypothetical protein ABI837_20230 [Acidobacteriota bacterium]